MAAPEGRDETALNVLLYFDTIAPLEFMSSTVSASAERATCPVGVVEEAA
jgi:hypothetical protein